MHVRQPEVAGGSSVASAMSFHLFIRKAILIPNGFEIDWCEQTRPDFLGQPKESGPCFGFAFRHKP
jgi:hypothetical protein